MNEITAVLEMAHRFLGVKEEDGNRGFLSEFCGYLIGGGDMREFPMGLLGAPWCATFAMTMLQLALGQQNPYKAAIGNPAFSDVDFLVDDARQRGAFLLGLDDESNPHRGDMFVVRSGPRKFKHVGFVYSTVRVEDNTFLTIEGNSNDDGSANGDGVYSIARPYGPSIALIRWERLVA